MTLVVKSHSLKFAIVFFGTACSMVVAAMHTIFHLAQKFCVLLSAWNISHEVMLLVAVTKLVLTSTNRGHWLFKQLTSAFN